MSRTLDLLVGKQYLMFMESPLAYNLSFTSASLRPELARIVAEYYRKEGDWIATKERILATNALQARSASTAIRLERELRQRLATLSEEQIRLLTEAPSEDRAAIAWLAAMKHSGFLFDFAAGVLREKLSLHDIVLRPSDYERFVEEKEAEHPELARLSPSSKGKIRRVLMRMLTEAGILTDGSRRDSTLGTIQRPVLSPAVLRSITADDRRWLAGFLVPDSEIETL